jgi:hypothetical protein
MRINSVHMWVGQPRPEKFQGEGPFEVSEADLAELAAEYDVAFMHSTRAPETKRDRANPPPDVLFLALDERGRRFGQR